MLAYAIPVYNVPDTIGEVIRRVLDCGSRLSWWTMLRPTILRSTFESLEHPQVHCFYHAANRSKGAAPHTGFAAAPIRTSWSKTPTSSRTREATDVSSETCSTTARTLLRPLFARRAEDRLARRGCHARRYFFTVGLPTVRWVFT